MTHSLLLILVITLVTLSTRMLPFLFFGGKRQPPPAVLYLGRVLPCAIMGMLVVYCLRGVTPMTYPHGLPELIGVAVAALLHIWRRNTLLSIAISTAVYMLLVQVAL